MILHFAKYVIMKTLVFAMIAMNSFKMTPLLLMGMTSHAKQKKKTLN